MKVQDCRDGIGDVEAGEGWGDGDNEGGDECCAQYWSTEEKHLKI